MKLRNIVNIDTSRGLRVAKDIILDASDETEFETAINKLKTTINQSYGFTPESLIVTRECRGPAQRPH